MPILSFPITAAIVALVFYPKLELLWIGLGALLLFDLVFVIWSQHRNYKFARFRLWELVIFGELIFRLIWNIISALHVIRGASQLVHSDIKRYKRTRA
ncbi:MAG: hypothetical protein ACYDCC_09100 [Actinomycetota bacterium]